MIHNMMEDIARQCLKDLLQRQPDPDEFDEKLQGDILAIVLNHLPPKYVSTQLGETFAKTQLLIQVQSDVFRELANAIDRVRYDPRRSVLGEARKE